MKNFHEVLYIKQDKISTGVEEVDDEDIINDIKIIKKYNKELINNDAIKSICCKKLYNLDNLKTFNSNNSFKFTKLLDFNSSYVTSISS